MVAIPEAIGVCFIDLLMSLYMYIPIRQPAQKSIIQIWNLLTTLFQFLSRSIDDLITFTASILCGPKAKASNTSPMQEVENEIMINVPHGENELLASKPTKDRHRV